MVDEKEIEHFEFTDIELNRSWTPVVFELENFLQHFLAQCPPGVAISRWTERTEPIGVFV